MRILQLCILLAPLTYRSAYAQTKTVLEYSWSEYLTSISEHDKGTYLRIKCEAYFTFGEYLGEKVMSVALKSTEIVELKMKGHSFGQGFWGAHDFPHKIKCSPTISGGIILGGRFVGNFSIPVILTWATDKPTIIHATDYHVIDKDKYGHVFQHFKDHGWNWWESAHLTGSSGFKMNIAKEDCYCDATELGEFINKIWENHNKDGQCPLCKNEYRESTKINNFTLSMKPNSNNANESSQSNSTTNLTSPNSTSNKTDRKGPDFSQYSSDDLLDYARKKRNLGECREAMFAYWALDRRGIISSSDPEHKEAFDCYMHNLKSDIELQILRNPENKTSSNKTSGSNYSYAPNINTPSHVKGQVDAVEQFSKEMGNVVVSLAQLAEQNWDRKVEMSKKNEEAASNILKNIRDNSIKNSSKIWPIYKAHYLVSNEYPVELSNLKYFNAAEGMFIFRDTMKKVNLINDKTGYKYFYKVISIHPFGFARIFHLYSPTTSNIKEDLYFNPLVDFSKETLQDIYNICNAPYTDTSKFYNFSLSNSEYRFNRTSNLFSPEELKKGDFKIKNNSYRKSEYDLTLSEDNFVYAVGPKYILSELSWNFKKQDLFSEDIAHYPPFISFQNTKVDSSFVPFTFIASDNSLKGIGRCIKNNEVSYYRPTRKDYRTLKNETIHYYQIDLSFKDIEKIISPSSYSPAFSITIKDLNTGETKVNNEVHFISANQLGLANPNSNINKLKIERENLAKQKQLEAALAKRPLEINQTPHKLLDEIKKKLDIDTSIVGLELEGMAAIKEFPDNCWGHYVYGLSLLRQGKFDESASAFKKAESKFDSTSYAERYSLGLICNQIGQTYWNLGMLDDTDKQFERAYNLFKNKLPFHLKYAYYLANRKQYNKSMEVLDYLDDYPNVSLVNATKSIVYFMQDDLKNALDKINSSIKHYEKEYGYKDDIIYWRIIEYKGDLMYQMAETFSSDIKKHDKYKNESILLWNQVLNTDYASIRVDEKIKNPRLFDFSHIKIWYKCFFGSSNEDAIENEDDKALFFANLGWWAYLKGAYTDAIRFSNSALAFRPDFYEVKFNLGLVYLVQNDSRCLKEYTDAIHLSRSDENRKKILRKIRDKINKDPIINSNNELTYLKEVLNLLSKEIDD